MYDGRFVHGIGNTAIFVRKGRVCVYYASIGGKMNLEAAQSSLQVITSLPVIQKVELFEGQNLVIPTGKLYSIQAAEASTVVISRFFCGLTIRRQISSYRQLYVSNVGFGAVREAQQTDDQFKWQFWKIIWLVAMRYVRFLRQNAGQSVGPSVVDEVLLSPQEKQSIPFLIVALKIMHENYGSQHNELQQFEQLLASKMDCLGPLDLLMELATRCRDNPWNSESHRLQHPDDMSATSEDTQAVLDISPYPDSIDSNVCIDQFVEDAEIPREFAAASRDRAVAAGRGVGESGKPGKPGNGVQALDGSGRANPMRGNAGSAAAAPFQPGKSGETGETKGAKGVIGAIGTKGTKGTVGTMETGEYGKTEGPENPGETGETGETGEANDSEESWEFRCECGVEGHNYDDGRPLVQCCRCKAWCHQECVGYKPEKDEEFFCRWCTKVGRPRKRKAGLLAGDPGRKSKGGRRGRL